MLPALLPPAVLHAASSVKTVSVEILNPNRLEYRKMIDFPGGSKKFTIRLDN